MSIPSIRRDDVWDIRTDEIQDGLNIDVELVPETLHVCHTIESCTEPRQKCNPSEALQTYQGFSGPLLLDTYLQAGHGRLVLRERTRKSSRFMVQRLPEEMRRGILTTILGTLGHCRKKP